MLIGLPKEPDSARVPPLAVAGERGPEWTAVDVADVALGLAVVALEGSRRVTARAGFVVRPLSALASEGVALGRRLRWRPRVVDVVERGARQRRVAARHAYGVGQRVAPRLVDGLLGHDDLTAVVPEHDDLDAIVAGVDVDAVVARVDLERIIDRIDVDAVVARADLEALLGRVDVDVVVARVDLERIIDRIDVDAVVGRADLDAVVAKLDLIALAEYVVEGIDLPGIIRSSTGSMASEGLREVRRQGIGADERVAHVVDRLLHRPERAPGSTYEEAAGEGPPGAPARHRARPGSGPGDPGLAH